MESTTTPILSAADHAAFAHDGYLAFPGFLSDADIARLSGDCDRLMADRAAGTADDVIGYPELGMLTSDQRVVRRVRELMDGDPCHLHHIHAVRQDPGTKGVAWHHDYEQHPQTNRSHVMVHCFFYLHGLNGEVGDLLLLPGSHNQILHRRALNMFGSEDLPGSLTIDDLPRGTMVIVHSALLHARRAKPGGDARPRYFVDISFCQTGVPWPAYPNHQRICRRALETGCGRGGSMDFLYDAQQFYDTHAVHEWLTEHDRGSLPVSAGAVPAGADTGADEVQHA